jgi:hypothetical protein
MPPLTTGFGNRDHLERNGKIESSKVGPGFCEVAQNATLQAQPNSFRFARWLTTTTPPVQLMIKEGICTKDLAYRSAQNPSQARAVFQEYLPAHRIGRV